MLKKIAHKSYKRRFSGYAARIWLTMGGVISLLCLQEFYHIYRQTVNLQAEVVKSFNSVQAQLENSLVTISYQLLQENNLEKIESG